MTEAIFWFLVILVAFAHAGFPLTVIFLGLWRRLSHACDDVTPHVTVLIAAHNEADGMDNKLRNTLEQDYPADRLNVVVVDDGSTDGTAEHVRALDDTRIRLIELPSQAGKVSALNRGIEACTGEIVLLTDANAIFEPDAIRSLVAPFADPEVGGVCGNQINRKKSGAMAGGEGLYWEFDKFLKRMESLAGSIVAADGSIYAIRRRFFETIPAGVTDDFFVSTAVIGHGKRLVFEEAAVSIEDPLQNSVDHYHRRVRIVEQSLRSLMCRRDLLNPVQHGVYAYILFGHKLLRRLASPAILLLFPTNAVLTSSGWMYILIFVLQNIFYTTAFIGWVRRTRARSKLLSAATYFALGNISTTVGLFRFALGKKRTVWEPIRR